jgi:hypothetical protein
LGRNAVKDQQLANSNWHLAKPKPTANLAAVLREGNGSKDLFFSPRSSVLIRDKVFGVVLVWPIASG